LDTWNELSSFGWVVQVTELGPPGPGALLGHQAWEWGSLSKSPFCFYLFICNTGVWTLGLALARQVLCHLSHAPSPFLLWWFLR
jgi:hypothetical protein